MRCRELCLAVANESATILAMADSLDIRRNWALWTGALLSLVALFSNGLYFLRPPAERILPWLSLTLAALALVCLLVGVRRAFASPPIYRGKIVGSILAIVSTLLFAFGIFIFVNARKLPSPNDAPGIGQKAPDFTLTDTSGQTIVLSELLAGRGLTATGAPPKAVLLVFYRGYW